MDWVGSYEDDSSFVPLRLDSLPSHPPSIDPPINPLLSSLSSRCSLSPPLYASALPPSASPRPVLDLQNTDGLTALMLACKASSPSFCEILLRHGADASLRDFSGQPALAHALAHNAGGCVQSLLRHAGFIDTRSRASPHGALFTAAQLNEPAVLRLLALRAPFLLQFLREIAQRPARREEIAVEVALRDELPRLPDALRAQLAALCVRQAQDCLARLLAVAERRADRRFRGSLAGLAGCAKWCIKMAKVLSKDPVLTHFEPFWARIEQMVRNQAAPSPRGGESEGSSGSSEEGAANGDSCGLAGESRREGKLRGKSASRLLLSFLEIYTLAHYRLAPRGEGSEEPREALSRLQSVESLDPRLIACFCENREYLR